MKKEFLIGIDSDGTAFDSMTIKHCRAFIPGMIEVWDLAPYAETVRRICEKINLYPPTRGIDRFSGLTLTFQRFAEAGIPVPETTGLEEFLKTGTLSNAALQDFLQKNDFPFLRQVLQWSRRADELFHREMQTLPPFPGVLPLLQAAAPRAEIAIVSSASEKSLRSDWSRTGLLEHADRLFGQEAGSKADQLREAAGTEYDGKHILMIGDAASDHRAAQSVGAWFYPMIPGQENRCWELLRERYLEIFFAGAFDSVQADLLKPFYEPQN